MKFESISLKDACVVTMEPLRDGRGYFARTFCRKEFEAHGIEVDMVQCNISFNRLEGTLRGMHFQREPVSESKLVHCHRGSVYDVIVDIRPDSPSYLQYFGLELTRENMKALFVPSGFAHGFLTLEDNTEISYTMDEFYAPECASGLRFDDPALGIDWPMPPKIVSEKDQNWPPFVC